MESRKEMKKEAEIQKHKINEAFYKMKLKGKLDQKTLLQLGISFDQPKSTLDATNEGKNLSPSKSFNDSR